MVDCVFCKIVSGDLQSYKIAESEHALAFLDIEPVTKGHVLVIPKNHAEDISDISEFDLAETSLLAKQVAKKIRRLYGCDVNLLHASGKAAQQSVFHFHMHIVPRKENDGLDLWPDYKAAELDLNAVYQEMK